LVTLLPGRVWPFLARSSFLGADVKGGMLATVVSTVETSLGDYSFLLAAIRLFEAVVEDAVTHAAVRRTLGNVSSKSDHVPEFSAGVPSYVMRNFLLALVRVMVEVYNSNASWRYNDLEQQFEINTALTTTFGNIVYYAYGIDDSHDLDSKLTGVLSSSAPYILNIIRPESTESLPFNPVLRIILDGLKTPTSTSDLRALFLRTRQVESALRLAERLIQIGSVTVSPISALETQLFNASPVLVRLYAFHSGYQLPVAALLDVLVSRVALDPEREPPSLFGHLGANSSTSFLDALAKFDRPFEDPALNIAIWRLLSSIVGKRQQWLAVFLLAGSSPRESLKKEATEREALTMRGKPFLEISLDLLSAIHKISPRVAASALNFVARAQENWPWATSELKKHPNFFQSILNFVSNLDMRSYSATNQCFITKIAGLVADICAIQLYSAQEARDMIFFKTLIPLVAWFSKNAVDVDAYNASLHSNLKKNFEMKYPGCKLLDIKRTLLGHAELGSDYFYDLFLGRKLFGYDFAWAGSDHQSLAAEVERANVNLSLVESQMVCGAAVHLYS
jgi:nuclear pore complex protein Nup188